MANEGIHDPSIASDADIDSLKLNVKRYSTEAVATADTTNEANAGAVAQQSDNGAIIVSNGTNFIRAYANQIIMIAHFDPQVAASQTNQVIGCYKCPIAATLKGAVGCAEAVAGTPAVRIYNDTTSLAMTTACELAAAWTPVAATVSTTAANIDIAAAAEIEADVTTAGGETSDATSAWIEIMPDAVTI